MSDVLIQKEPAKKCIDGVSHVVYRILPSAMQSNPKWRLMPKQSLSPVLRRNFFAAPQNAMEGIVRPFRNDPLVITQFDWDLHGLIRSVIILHPPNEGTTRQRRSTQEHVVQYFEAYMITANWS